MRMAGPDGGTSTARSVEIARSSRHSHGHWGLVRFGRGEHSAIGPSNLTVLKTNFARSRMGRPGLATTTADSMVDGFRGLCRFCRSIMAQRQRDLRRTKVRPGRPLGGCSVQRLAVQWRLEHPELVALACAAEDSLGSPPTNAPGLSRLAATSGDRIAWSGDRIARRSVRLYTAQSRSLDLCASGSADS
jgi:hypothetical protein